MAKKYLADKPTLDEVNSKVGTTGDAASGTSLFAKVNNLLNTLANHAAAWTSARAAKMDNLDAAISSRAPASTALSTAQWTNTRAGYLDNINTKANNLDSRLTAARAGYLDKLNSGVAVSSLTGKIVKSIQRGTVIIGIGKTEATATISYVDVNKAIVVFSGSSIEDFSGGIDYMSMSAMARLTLESATQIKAVRYSGGGEATVPYQVIEFY